MMFTPNTAKSYSKQLKGFLLWQKSKGIRNRRVVYADVIEYLDCLKSRNLSHSAITGILKSMSHYFNFKGYKKNPVQNVKIKGREKKVLKNLRTQSEIDNIYLCYKELERKSGSVHARNLVVLGLVCYQGLKTNEIGLIEVEMVDFKKQTIEIPATIRTNKRILRLQVEQLLDLYQYVSEYRQEFIGKLGLKESRFLLVGNQRESDLGTILRQIPIELKKTRCRFVHFVNIRSSVIVNWLKTNSLRKVQYMAGHRCVSSTEKYREADISKLKNVVMKKHPMG